MRGLLWFILGFGCGAGATLVWLRKDVKKELEKVESSCNASTEPELPFTVGESKDTGNSENARREPVRASESISSISNATSKENREKYHEIIQATMTNPAPLFQNEPLQVPVAPRDESEEEEEQWTNLTDVPEGVFEIDYNTFQYDNDNNEKERVVYYRGDRILSTENGAKIPNPAMLIGSHWEAWVGHYAKHTAFIRNPKLATDYEVYVEEGSYADEWGQDNTLDLL